MITLIQITTIVEIQRRDGFLAIVEYLGHGQGFDIIACQSYRVHGNVVRLQNFLMEWIAVFTKAAGPQSDVVIESDIDDYPKPPLNEDAYSIGSLPRFYQPVYNYAIIMFNMSIYHISGQQSPEIEKTCTSIDQFGCERA